MKEETERQRMEAKKMLEDLVREGPDWRTKTTTRPGGPAGPI